MGVFDLRTALSQRLMDEILAEVQSDIELVVADNMLASLRQAPLQLMRHVAVARMAISTSSSLRYPTHHSEHCALHRSQRRSWISPARPRPTPAILLATSHLVPLSVGYYHGHAHLAHFIINLALFKP